MENFLSAKKIIESYQDICIFPSPEPRGDIFPASLALFYSLKNLGKNVNLVFSNFPEKFKFLAEGLEKNFLSQGSLITIKESSAKISQVFYEKVKGELKLYLKSFPGIIKKEDIFFKSLFSPELVISFGVKNPSEIYKTFPKEDFSILNINNNYKSELYGKVNLISPSSFSEIVFSLIELWNDGKFSKEVANSLLAGLAVATNNFQKAQAKPEVFEQASALIENGANQQQITSKLYPRPSLEAFRLWGKILGKIEIIGKRNTIFALLKENDFEASRARKSDLAFSLEKLKETFPNQEFLLLWQEYNSPIGTKGVFYSEDASLKQMFLREFDGQQKGNGVLFFSPAVEPLIIRDKFLDEISKL